MGRKRGKSGKRDRRGRGSRKRAARRRERRFNLLLGGLLLVAMYFAVFGGEYTLFELKRLERLKAERAAELARSEAQIDSLARLAEELRSDSAAIERVARERYGMIREGEILYRFRGPDRD